MATANFPPKRLPHNRNMPHNAAMRFLPNLAPLALLSGCATPAVDRIGPGSFTLDEGPDAAGQLVLGADRRFTYVLTAGALDEHSHGRWETADDKACLFTEPEPVPPRFARLALPISQAPPGHLLVAGPNGESIPGVDFRIGFADGSQIEGYTQHDGWTLARDEMPVPRWIELFVPMHEVVSPRFDLAEGDEGPWHFELKPNDLGVVDFDGECLERQGDAYALERRGGRMRFVRTDR
jgi:hypothetical protein